jgi:Na+-translocating ferredoxin:NAD+ oxidoreductase RNF subunit RnfB
MAMNLNWKWQPLEIIFNQSKEKKPSINQLESFLDKMVEKGTLNFKRKEEKKYYANAPIVVGMYEYQLTRLDKELVKDFFHYIMETFGFEIMRTKISQLRTVPIEQSITREINIATYEDIKKIFENAKQPIAITDCICKKGRDLMGHPCKITERLEICMAFDWIALLYIDQGWARQITRQEALEVLRKNEEDGLIINVENTEDPIFFCGCCTCCCGLTAGLKYLHQPGKLAGNNYYAVIDSELCSGCGLCIERCQMDAIQMIDEVSQVKKNRCIGCGNCIATCPIEAIRLMKKDKITEPPKDFEDLYGSILEAKNQIKEKHAKKKQRSKI